MIATIVANELAVRLGFFLGIFVLMIFWEIAVPRSTRSVSRWVRWPSNLGIVAFNALLCRHAGYAPRPPFDPAP